MYSVDMVPADLLPYFMANPMTPIIMAFRDVLYYGRFPEIDILFLPFVESIVLLIIGEVIFHRLQRGFAEEL